MIIFISSNPKTFQKIIQLYKVTTLTSNFKISFLANVLNKQLKDYIKAEGLIYSINFYTFELQVVFTDSRIL